MKEEKSKSLQVSKPFFLRSESASSTVVGAVLLLAIIVMVLSVIRLGYVPEWKNDAEYSHMNDVWGDMTDLKSKIDLMTIVLASDPDSLNTDSSNDITMSVPFHMGGGDLPLIGTIKSSGTLSVNKDECVMTLIPYGGNATNISCSTISYNSQNRYYVDQNFIYEGGALILSQGDQSSMMLYPSIHFSRGSTNKYTVSINAVEIYKKQYAAPDIISSNTGCSLRLTGQSFHPLYDSTDSNETARSFNLTIETTHPDAWHLYLKETMADARIEDYELKTPTNTSVRLIFPTNLTDGVSPAGESLERLYVSKTVVKAEPGIGI